ncbi:hypothetical protein GRI43_10650 [Altererythrobacter luteolus]|uniref:Lipoprotein n=1 Tax=Pontixanthobacter luteolus TaxID=295089 RepID=A0A6I4V3C2_9SPHN|nr:hypothetical protein [Pontixanthobacter luteolus]MXP47841.1 hypothetical protein [Pontixanthobacter luteolus]
MTRALNLAALTFSMFGLQACMDAPDAKKENASDAFLPIEQQGFPEMYQRIGPIAFGRANTKADSALALIADRPSCDGVELAGVSDTSTSEDIVWYAYCFNGSKETISEGAFQVEKK